MQMCENKGGKIYMKIKVISKIFSFMITSILLIPVFGGNSSFAFDNNYTTATVLGSSATGYITISDASDWYKFTLNNTQVPTAYSINLRIPDECVYNFDFRYQAENSNDRPSIISNETLISATRTRSMRGILTEAGTYYIRVFSQDGSTSSSEEYRLSTTHSRNLGQSITYYSTPPMMDNTDWCACADLVGNYLYGKRFLNGASTRNYQNAYTFIMSDYTSDSQSGFTNENKATPEQTAKAADYIYSGDILLTPKFEVETNTIYAIEELSQYLWQYGHPVIFYLENEELISITRAFSKYVALNNVNIGENTIRYYNSTSGGNVTVDYDDFLLDGMNMSGIALSYTGTNIVPSNYKTQYQPAYN